VSLVLDGEWLKAKLIAKAKGSMGAELTIASATLTPLTGSASLAGVRLTKNSKTGELDVQLDEVRVKLRLLPLLFGKVHLAYVEVDGPRIRVRRKGKSSLVQTGIGILTNTLTKRILGGEEEEEKKEFQIDRLVIRSGQVNFTKTFEGAPDFTASIADLEYAASDIALDNMHRLVYGADIRCTIDMGSKVTIEKSGSTDPATFSARGISVPAACRYLGADSYVGATAGTMDVSYSISGDGEARVEADFSGLRLKSSGVIKAIGFDKLIGFVESKDGNLKLVYTYDSSGLSRNADMAEMMSSLWQGLFTAMILRPSSSTEIAPAERRDSAVGTRSTGD